MLLLPYKNWGLRLNINFTPKYKTLLPSYLNFRFKVTISELRPVERM